MKTKDIKLKSSWLAGAALVAVGLSGCGGDSSSHPDEDDMATDTTTYEYEVSVTNLTAGQPFSPLSVVLHNQSWQAFELGEAASTEIEIIAESGDNTQFIAAATADDDAYAVQGGAGIVGPGASETISIETDASGTLSLSVVSMLVNTNDALTALSGVDVSGLAVGESVSYRLRTYDAGTEANSETADTIPGPAATGGAREGYNVARDDVRDEVYVHAGVVTSDDGLATSALTEAHRWDNPAASVVISRIQ